MTNKTIKGEITNAPDISEGGILDEVLDVYEELLRTIWAKIVPTLGAVTVVTIIRRSLQRTCPDHPTLERLDLSDSGFKFDDIRNKSSEVEVDEIKLAFAGLVANLFDILVKLTGNILVQQLSKEVDGLEVP